ncbi:MAG: segregation/condensation protein A [Candidatus Nanoarchaeia archaeon]|nr:segregation/condensation protein A [Candidatus Nanoarchaeia archaeon]MDD5357786.1 segregation/condensation protein A [Candidatus Nanoarchaeia archaeon]MDD5588705.1 segregation/condensation protein A [Candidatus Nanoarchaeia archaeon]
METEEKGKNSVQQEQIHDLLFNREIGWQEIIYDLINTEQLNPWDINIIVLSDKYLEKIREIEEADFFVSSKVLLAASLLLRIKSEILLNRYIKSIDEILFGKKEPNKTAFERIELDDEIPELIPRSPMPRFKKVTLKELMESLNKAIVTENRRIKKEIVSKNTLRESSFSLPKRKFSIKDKITEIYRNLTDWFSQKKENKVSFTEFLINKDEKIISFLPLLYLEDQKKIWLEQKNPFDEVHIWLRETFLKNNPDPFEDLRKELEEYDKNPENFKDEEINEEDEEEE